MRILLAIESCKAHVYRHPVMEETWLKDCPIDYRFFIGGAGLPDGKKEVRLAVSDSYDYLSLKTHEICRWAISNRYDFLFKADTDTVISMNNLIASGFESRDYLGGLNEDEMPANLVKDFSAGRIQFASGGAGYWLSRRAMEKIAYGPIITTCAEDVYVAAVLRAGALPILPEFNPNFKWKPGEKIDEDTISYHTSSALGVPYNPDLIYEAHKIFEGYKVFKDSETQASEKEATLGNG
jgi:hypothetical protein